LNGIEVYEKVNNIHHVFENLKKKSSVTNIWKRKWIFFDLPYRLKLEVRHCINVMHGEKNECNNFIGTLLHINEKINDSVNACLDLIDMHIRKELTQIKVGKRTYLSQTCYIMSKEENK